MQWNISGVTSAKLQLEDVQLAFLQHDVVFLSETWLKPGSPFPRLPPALSLHFEVQLCSRPWVTNTGRNLGGVAALVRRGCPALKHSRWDADVANGILWGVVPCQGASPSGSLHLVGCYFSPCGSNIYNKYGLSDPFLELHDRVQTRVRVLDTVTICGDFNARMGGLSHAPAAQAPVWAPASAPCRPAPSTHALPPLPTVDTRSNEFGVQLASLLASSGLCALNGRAAGNNSGWTYHGRQNRPGHSVVDWVLSSPDLLSASQCRVSLDIFPLLPESDHTMLSLSVCVVPRVRTWGVGEDVPAWAWDLITPDDADVPLTKWVDAPCVWNDDVRTRCVDALTSPDFSALLQGILLDNDPDLMGTLLQDVLSKAVQTSQPSHQRGPPRRKPTHTPYFDQSCHDL